MLRLKTLLCDGCKIKTTPSYHSPLPKSAKQSSYQAEIFSDNIKPANKKQTVNPFRFTARRTDDETALYYYRARYYAFYIDRFLQTDPIGYADGLNRYAYVKNSPINYLDPLGLKLIIMGGKDAVNKAHDYLAGAGPDFEKIIAEIPSENMKPLPSGKFPIFNIVTNNDDIQSATVFVGGAISNAHTAAGISWNPDLGAISGDGDYATPASVL
ncbi:MAG: RHS repeat-associated core domain-containing protein [Planctomycetes bacterium]|nr:RHS repeat-associated core domain-containing protein [Planctomycetota bacterium]